MVERLPQADPFQKSRLIDFLSARRRLAKIVAIGLFLFGFFVLALGAGLFFFKNQSSSSDDIQIISAHSDDPINQSEIIVHIDGAVANPGLYKLAASSRVDDAVKMAGGLRGDADMSKVNLAAKVADGQKIYIPASGEVTSDKSQVISQNTYLININNASESELDKLPGIGPVTAQKIVAGRPYSSLEDLLTKKAVSRSVFEKIKDLISL